MVAPAGRGRFDRWWRRRTTGSDHSQVVGRELKFYLCEPDPASRNGYRPYAAQDSGVYTVGQLADPNGTLSRMLDAAVELELDSAEYAPRL